MCYTSLMQLFISRRDKMKKSFTQSAKKILVLALTICMVITASVVPVFAGSVVGADYTGKVVILHTNDVHGAIQNYTYVAGLKADLEKKGADVILVDAGDYSQGKTTVSVSKGESAIDLMNLVGYDYATVGNHEFDYGYEQLKSNLEKAQFQVLCANIKYEGANAFGADAAYAVKEKGGVKVGFFGLDTPEAQTKVNPALIQGITVLAEDTGLWDCAKDQVAALQAAKADVIICLAHLGVDAESVGHQSYDLVANVSGIDMVIDGHSHTVMTKGDNGEAIQSTGTEVANIGMIVIDKKTKKIVNHDLVPLDEVKTTVKEVSDKASEIQAEIDAEYGVKFAESKVELNGAKAPNGNRDSETNNGDLITDAMMWYLTEKNPGSIKSVDADKIVAITNGGGIRATIKAGDVTKNDILSVLPFGNTLAVVYVTGEELLESLEASTYCTPEAVGAFPQIAGLDITVDTTNEFAKAELYPGSTYNKPAEIRRVTINSVNGKAFDPTAKYAVLTNNFCAAGGDTYYAFKAATEQFDTGVTMDVVVMDYITEALNGVIGEEYAAPQGRIEVIKGETKHVFGEFVSDENSTYKEDGTKTAKCLYCDETIQEPEHMYGMFHYNYNATLCKDGTMTGKCLRCGEPVTVVVKGSHGHKLGAFFYDFDASCTKNGTWSSRCLCCGKLFKVEVEDSRLPHNYGEFVSDNNATCTEDGTKTATCACCGETYTVVDEGTALGHEFGEFVSDNNATCTADGTKTATCARCGEKLTVVDEGSMLKHVDANKDGKCDNCGAEVEVPVVPVTGDANDLVGMLFLLGAAVVTTAACYRKKESC